LIRLTGGEFRGRIIKTPRGETTRPTQARLRQALFNSIQTLISEARVLDLFSGSGALGFESLSRGAQSVVFVEDSRPALKMIQANARDLGVQDRISLISLPVEKSFSELLKLGPFDIILADPPYAGGWETKLLQTLPWHELLAENGHFCLEWGVQKSEASELPDAVSSENTPARLVKVREKNYGDSALTTFKRSDA
jgi:16S rRNA (guanine966-N2)-methyltransferase